MHTPEPWIADEVDDIWRTVYATNGGRDKIICISVSDTNAGGGDGIIVRVYGPNAEDDAARIVACVAACEDIPDPASAIRAAREAMKDALETIAAMAERSNLLTDDEAETTNTLRAALAGLGGTA